MFKKLGVGARKRTTHGKQRFGKQPLNYAEEQLAAAAAKRERRRKRPQGSTS